MIINVKLEVETPNELSIKDIEKDLRLAERQIGWEYDYFIKTVEYCPIVSGCAVANGGVKVNDQNNILSDV